MSRSSTGLPTNGNIPQPIDAFEGKANFVASQPDLHIGTPSQRYPRISKPVELLRPSYDVVVIGSGYGGGVAASRMARGDQSVCVLERGKERWPGEYPSGLVEGAPELHVHGKSTVDPRVKYLDVGNPIGLYNLSLGDGQNVFTACGLGGTSLLNANIFLPADKKTLGMSEWPADIRENPDILDPYYKRAESVLQPEPYPTSYPELSKLSLLQKQAKMLGWEHRFYRPPQTTRFEDGPNSTGVMMHASTGSASDSTGVNDGSKITTLVTYLSDAWNWGAEIFCECEVKYIKHAPKGEGYIVYFAWHGAKRGKFGNIFANDLMWVHAKKFVFLGAGTLGTTEILLRSQQLGLSMSNEVGAHMSGNGDIFAFGYNSDHDANALEREHPDPLHPVGPTITGIIDCRDQANPLDGFVLEEGAAAKALVPALRLLLEASPGAIYSNSLHRTFFQRFLARQKSWFFGPYVHGGSLQRTQIYLIMSHDSNQANLILDDKSRPIVKWLGVGRSKHTQTLNDVMARATKDIGGTFINNPFFSFLNGQEISVHPIGGAAFSADGTPEEGVTTTHGELLTGIGEGFHKGIICVDGSVIPVALGVNPFATITALAERSVECVADKKGIKIDYETRNGVLDLFGPPGRSLSLTTELQYATDTINESKRNNAIGTSFSEVMEGYMHAGGDIEDFHVAEKVASGLSSTARFFLSVNAWDTTELVKRSDHPAMITGSFCFPALSKDPFIVLRGKFQLFSDDPRTPNTQNLAYDFNIISTSGEVYIFHGRKLVDPSISLSPIRTWNAESTLYVSIYRAKDEALVGRGILHIHPSDFVDELQTFTPTGPDLFGKLKGSLDFFSYFTMQTSKAFFAPLAALAWPDFSTTTLRDKPLPSEMKRVTAEDGVQSKVLVWIPQSKKDSSDCFLDPAVPVLFIPGASVDHRIFAMPTLKRNAIEYFTDQGSTCFNVTHRVGKTEAAKKGWSTYDARLDIAAALAFILKRYPPGTKVYIVAHCAGSVALSMGLLDGTIPTQNIQGITASNVFMNPLFATVNWIKASSPISMATIYEKLAGSWFSCDSEKDDTFIQQILNQVLRFYPVGSRKEICNSVVCHRSELVFGRLWTHRNLNSETHANLDDFLGGVSMNALRNLMHNGTHGYVTTWPSPSEDSKGANVVNLATDENLHRLSSVPIYFFSGSENAVYSPESTDISFTKLLNLGTGRFERDVFEGFGHLDCWMGQKAETAIWPRVREHMKKVSKKVV